RFDRSRRRKLRHIRRGDTASTSSHPCAPVASVGDDASEVTRGAQVHRHLFCHRHNGVMGIEDDESAKERALKVLVVDDEPAITQLLAMALRYDGWEVATAATGAEAIAMSESFEPDVMVLDVMLPDFDGMQVLSRLRGNGELLPVLFLTALD